TPPPIQQGSTTSTRGLALQAPISGHIFESHPTYKHWACIKTLILNNITLNRKIYPNESIKNRTDLVL
ncbi:hypothetical protein DY279_005002, partial [Escherichia coli]